MSAALSGTATNLEGARAGAASDGGLSPERLHPIPSTPLIDETSLSFVLRLRHGLLGLAIGTLALVACAVLALLIVARPFHTSLASLR